MFVLFKPVVCATVMEFQVGSVVVGGITRLGSVSWCCQGSTGL